MDAIATRAWRLTHDWLFAVERAGSANALHNWHRVYAASADLGAIDACEAFWLLAPETGSAGAWVELGYAFARQRADHCRVVISGAGSKRTIFGAFGIEVATDDEALRWLERFEATRFGGAPLPSFDGEEMHPTEEG
jgi:hypothetical protein